MGPGFVRILANKIKRQTIQHTCKDAGMPTCFADAQALAAAVGSAAVAVLALLKRRRHQQPGARCGALAAGVVCCGRRLKVP
jgi:hypothetical protein